MRNRRGSIQVVATTNRKQLGDSKLATENIIVCNPNYIEQATKDVNINRLKVQLVIVQTERCNISLRDHISSARELEPR